MTIEEFKLTNDYRDICYMIKHVPYVDARLSVLTDLGYKLVPRIIKDEKNNLEKEVFVDKKNHIQIQVSNKIKNKPFAWCVVI